MFDDSRVIPIPVTEDDTKLPIPLSYREVANMTYVMNLVAENVKLLDEVPWREAAEDVKALTEAADTLRTLYAVAKEQADNK